MVIAYTQKTSLKSVSVQTKLRRWSLEQAAKRFRPPPPGACLSCPEALRIESVAPGPAGSSTERRQLRRPGTSSTGRRGAHVTPQLTLSAAGSLSKEGACQSPHSSRNAGPTERQGKITRFKTLSDPRRAPCRDVGAHTLRGRETMQTERLIYTPTDRDVSPSFSCRFTAGPREPGKSAGLAGS